MLHWAPLLDCRALSNWWVLGSPSANTTFPASCAILFSYFE